MSLGFVMKCNQVTIPMVLLNTGTSSMISDCKLNGNGSIPTCGIVVKKSTCIIKDTAIEGFISGGIMMWLEGTNICKIFGTKVRDCKTVAIQVMGNSSNPLIECCEIENNKGPGIQVCTANTCQIRKNRIINNTEGIEIISADPTIFKNTISQNNANGVVSRSVDG